MDAQQLIALLDQAIDAADPPSLAVAVSGGLDSSVLAHALSASPQARRRGLRVLNVDHGLHADSAHWSAKVAADCAAWAVPFLGLRCEVTRDSGLGLEAAAREARYAVLAQTLKAGEWLALAHHRDDQAETVLLRLLRGAGTAALGGMPASRPLGEGRLWRPLLNVGREALLAYARQAGLHWIEDPANTDSQHDRSWLRAQVLPMLFSRWPQAAVGITRSAALLAVDGELLVEQAALALAQVRDTPSTVLSIPGLRALSPALRAHVLRHWLAIEGADPLPGHLHAELETMLHEVSVDAAPQLRWRGSRLRRYRTSLHLDVDLSAVAADLPENGLCWDGCEPLLLPDGSTLHFDPPLRDPACFRVSARVGGERIRLPGRTHRHQLKHVLQTQGIPPWQRQQLPLLWDETGELLAAGDRILSATLTQALQTEGRRFVWRPPASR